MTALNFALARDQVLVATDTLVSGADEALFGSKCVAIPHARLIVAGAGVHRFIKVWFSVLLGTFPLVDFEDLDVVTPERLRSAWAHLDNKAPTAIFHFGVTRSDRVTGFTYASETEFVSRRIRPGAYICPALADRSRRPAPPSRAKGEPEEFETLPDLCSDLTSKWPWADRVRSIIDVMPQQQRENPGSIGGRIQVTTLTPYCIHQHWLGELSPAGAAETGSSLSPSQESTHDA